MQTRPRFYTLRVRSTGETASYYTDGILSIAHAFADSAGSSVNVYHGDGCWQLVDRNLALTVEPKTV